MKEITFNYDIKFSVLDADIYNLFEVLGTPWRTEIIEQRFGLTAWQIRAGYFMKLGVLSVIEKPNGSALLIREIDHDTFNEAERLEKLYEFEKFIQSHIETELLSCKEDPSNNKEHSEKTTDYPGREADRFRWEYLVDKVIKPQVILDNSLLKDKKELLDWLMVEVVKINKDGVKGAPSNLPEGIHTLKKIIDLAITEIEDE